MNPRLSRMRLAAPLLLLTGLATTTVSAQPELGGTSWRLARFQGSDDTALTPGASQRYTIAFETDGRVSVRIDCNQGRGTWKSAGPNQLEFGPLALTRAMCPPGSLHDRIVKHWPFVRSYIIKEGHLFLTLMADGGSYDFEPMSSEGSGRGAAAGPVQGTATYRERIGMPQDAVFEATLEDVSRAGARAEVIARIRNEQPGNPPIPFLIAFDPARINPSHRYAVRARILVAEKLWFTTDVHHPVLTAGHGNEVQIVLRRAGGLSPVVPAPAARPSTAPLEDTYWKLITLGDAPVKAAPRQTDPHFILHPATRRVTGSGGCNRLTGSYATTGDRLSFSQILITMMACIEGMGTETGFRKALGRVSRWKVTGQQLELFDADGTRLARFEAAYMK